MLCTVLFAVFPPKISTPVHCLSFTLTLCVCVSFSLPLPLPLPLPFPLPLSLPPSLPPSHPVPQTKILHSAVEKGNNELVTSIISDLCTQINPPNLPQTRLTSQSESTPDTRILAEKPVLQTGKTGSDESAMDGVETGDKTGCVEAGGDKCESSDGVMGEGGRVLRRKRKVEQTTGEAVNTKKPRKSKDERDQEDRKGAELPVAKDTDKISTWVEFDVSVVMETGVDNCNILHVCCGAVDVGVSAATVEGVGKRRLDILEEILTCLPLRPVILTLVSVCGV